MKMKKMLAALMCIMMLFSLAACGGNASSQSSSSGGDAALSVKISHHPYVHAMPSVYAEEHGILDEMFKDWSIDYYANGPVQNEAIASGAWEVGTTGTGGAILGAAGYNLKTIGFTTPDTGTIQIIGRGNLFSGKTADAKGVVGTADDWRGKTILCTTGSSCHMLLIATLDYLGLTMDDIDLIDVSVANAYTAFTAGEGDIACLWEPFTFQSVAEGNAVISSSKDFGLNQPCLIVATEEALKNNREAVVAWARMYFEIGDLLNEDFDATAELMSTFQNGQGIATTVEEARQTLEVKHFVPLEENVELFTPDENGVMPAQTILLDYADFMISQGKITEQDKEAMLANQFVDPSVIQEIVAGK